MHYISVFFIFTAAYAVLFYEIEKMPVNWFSSFIQWFENFILFILIYFLIIDFLSLIYKRNDEKKTRFRIYAGILSLIVVEVFWIMSFLPFRYRPTALLLFLMYYILFEVFKFKILPKISLKKKVVVFNIIIALSGIILILSTTKWGY